MTLTIKMEATPGEMITDVCAEVVHTAERLGLNVEVMFNGVMLVSYRGGSPGELESAYYVQLEKGGIAFTHGGMK